MLLDLGNIYCDPELNAVKDLGQKCKKKKETRIKPLYMNPPRNTQACSEED